MSLINDALKRTKQVQQQRQPTATSTPPPSPVEVTPHGTAWFFPAAIILLVAVACFFIAFAFFALRRPAAQTVMVTQSIPVVAAAPVAQKAPLPPPVPTIAPAPKPAPPALKVQGIFYNDAKWQAIVNRQSVFVGDSVDGFRVKLISKNSVLFIAPDGTQKTFALGN